MNALQSVLVGYVLFMMLRILYSLCTGFLYVRPTAGKLKDELVTVIVPAWNEEKGISKTMGSIMKSTYKNLQLIVVNDGSTDGTLKEIERFIRGLGPRPKQITVISQHNQGKAAALTNAIKVAKGGVVVTVDADSYIPPDTIRRLMLALSDGRYSVAIGQVAVGNTGSLLGLMQYYEYLFGFHLKRGQHMFGSIFIFPGALTAVRKEVIESVDYYDSYTVTEDLDLSMKIKIDGHRVAYVDDAICITEGASDLKGLVNQRTRWRHGFLECVLHRKDFSWKKTKGHYLSFVDFPLALIGTLEILLFPLFAGFIIWQSVIGGDGMSALLSYLILPYTFILLAGKEMRSNYLAIATAIFIPLFFIFLNLVELVALCKSIYRMVTGRKTQWTRWERKGV